MHHSSLYLVALLVGMVYGDPGPSGGLIEPTGGTVWYYDNGIGLGHVQYQGQPPFYNTDEVNHITFGVVTSYIDLSLQTVDGTTVFQLANGLRPNPVNYMVDYWFRIPVSSGDYSLVVVETQELTTGQPAYAGAYSFTAAAPNITISSGSVPTTRRSVEYSDPVNAQTLGKRSAPAGQLNIPSGTVVWDNTDGFGFGQIEFQGINIDYADPPISHVNTLSVDIWLDSQSNFGPPYWLAQGIWCNATTWVLDASFHVPLNINGTYVLYVNETQVTQDSTAPLLSNVVDDSSVIVLINEPWRQVYDDAQGSNQGATQWPTAALILVSVLGVGDAILISYVLYYLFHRNCAGVRIRRGRSSSLDGHEMPTTSDGVHFAATPFLSAPPSIRSPQAAEDAPPPMYDKSSRSIYSSSDSYTATMSHASSSPVVPTHRVTRSM